jgi:outer membrane protein assembly factor BamC
MKAIRYASLIAPLLILAGCSSTSDAPVFEDRKYEYKKESTVGRDLEVPPDLTKSTIGTSLRVPGGDDVTFSEYGTRPQAPAGIDTNQVLPGVEGIEVKRDGDQRWLLINSPPARVWPRVVAFWQENGILLAEQNPALGTMTTDWLENRADIASDFITDTLRGVFDGLYSSPTRDQFRVRLEEGRKPGSTELYLTHRGVVQELVTAPNMEDEQGVWQPRETDHQAEAEMLRRLMIFMGIAEQRASAQIARKQSDAPRSRMIKGANGLTLSISEDMRRSWRLIGVALDRVGFLVEDRNRPANYYLVRYDDPLAGQQEEGFFSKLNFWSDDEAQQSNLYRVQLINQGTGSQVLVADEQGQRLTTKTAERILNLIHEQID